MQHLPKDSLGPDWITLKEASRLSGAALSTWTLRAKRESQCARSDGRTALARKAPPSSGKGRYVWWVHRSIDPKLTRHPDRSMRADRVSDALRTKYPQHHVNAACRKDYWLQKWRMLCEGNRDASVTGQMLAERVVREAKIVEVEGFKIGCRTLRNWRNAYNALGANGQVRGVEGLIHGCVTADGAGRGVSRSPEAIEYFYSLYHTENKLAVVVCHEMTLDLAKRRKWAWPETCAATTRWLREHDALSLSYLLREGKDKWCRRYMPHIEIDYRLILPGQMYQTDHHVCDFWVDHEGKKLRPWLTAVQDMRSRCIVGWHLGPAPHQDAIVAAYLMAFRDWAIPEKLRIDNGKDFASALLTGVTKKQRDQLRRLHGSDWQRVLKRDENLVDCRDPAFHGLTAELQIDTVYAIPYCPWSKGQTERWFGTFEGRCGKAFTTYCGNKPDTRPEALTAILKREDIPTMADARVVVGEYIDEYHNTQHSAEDMEGMAPLAMWATAQSLRLADDEALLVLMQTRGVFKVGGNGVAFKVGGARLTYGRGCPALYKHIGRKVAVAIDTNDLSVCYAFTPERDNRRFISRLEANERISPMADADTLREANANIARERKTMRKAGIGSVKRTRNVATEMAAMRRGKRVALQATGTDNATPNATIKPVRTGFEGVSKVARTAAQAPRSDRELRDLAAARAALGAGRGLSKRPRRARVSDDVLRGPTPSQANDQTETNEDVTKDGCEDTGTDAARQSSTDLLKLIGGGSRHGQEQQ